MLGNYHHSEIPEYFCLSQKKSISHFPFPPMHQPWATTNLLSFYVVFLGHLLAQFLKPIKNEAF
jgi:hypothetical protein